MPVQPQGRDSGQSTAVQAAGGDGEPGQAPPFPDADLMYIADLLPAGRTEALPGYREFLQARVQRPVHRLLEPRGVPVRAAGGDGKARARRAADGRHVQALQGPHVRGSGPGRRIAFGPGGHPQRAHCGHDQRTWLRGAEAALAAGTDRIHPAGGLRPHRAGPRLGHRRGTWPPSPGSRMANG